MKRALLLAYLTYSTAIGIRNTKSMPAYNPSTVMLATVGAPLLLVPSGLIHGFMGMVFAAGAAGNNNGRVSGGMFVTAGAGLLGGVFGTVFGLIMPFSLLSPIPCGWSYQRPLTNL